MKRRILCLVGLLWSLFLLESCGNEPSVEKEPDRTAVQAGVLGLSDAEVVKTYTGTLEGEQQAVLYARVAEAVEAVHVSEGDRVSTGEILVSLDRSGTSSRYQEALSLYRNAEKTFNKMAFLYEEGAVSESEHDAAQTDYEVAKAAFESAARLVGVESPIDGIVTSLNVFKGNFLVVGQEVATVAAIDRLRVDFAVDAADVGSIGAGTPVTVSDGEKAVSSIGSVQSVARSADPRTRTFQVEAVIDNEGHVLRPGLFVRVSVPLRRLTGVITVPRRTLVMRDEGDVVFVVSNGLALVRDVVLGDDLGGRVVVDSGLWAGDTLVVVGQEYLADSAQVDIVELREIGP